MEVNISGRMKDEGLLVIDITITITIQLQLRIYYTSLVFIV